MEPSGVVAPLACAAAGARGRRDRNEGCSASPIVGRDRTRETDQTVKRRIDVKAAFAAEERPTRPAVRELVPLDAVPVLALNPAELPWEELGELAAQILVRVDGRTRAMQLVTGNVGSPGECACELAVLARRGLVRLLPPATDADGMPLEIDLTML